VVIILNIRQGLPPYIFNPVLYNHIFVGRHAELDRSVREKQMLLDAAKQVRVSNDIVFLVPFQLLVCHGNAGSQGQ